MASSTHISKMEFIITTSILSSLALATTILRFALRLHRTRTLRPDDLVLTLSLFSLVSAAALSYPLLSHMYADDGALARAPPTTATATATTAHSRALECLLWSAVYGVKGSLMASFKESVGAICPGHVKLYYVGVCCAVVACWAFSLATPFVAGNEGVVLIITYLSTAVDVITLGLVFSLSVPLIILHRPLSSHQTVFVCGLVSLVLGMTALSVLLSVYRHLCLDKPLHTLLLFLEGCTAVIAASTLAIGLTLKEGREPRKHMVQFTSRDWQPGTLTSRSKKKQIKRVEELLEDGNNDADGDSVTGLRTLVRGGSPESPLRAVTTDHNENVICTREVVVKVQYEEDLGKSDFDRITNPRWIDHKWEQKSCQSSLSGEPTLN